MADIMKHCGSQQWLASRLNSLIRVFSLEVIEYRLH